MCVRRTNSQNFNDTRGLMAEGTNGRRRFSDKWGKHELDVLAVLSSAFPQWLTSRQIAQRVKAYADSYGELADQAAKAAFAKQFQRDRAKLAAMGIAIESRQPEYSSKSEGQDFASYRLQLGDEPRIRMHFNQEDMPVLAAANYLARSIAMSQEACEEPVRPASRTTPRVPQVPIPGLGLDSIAPGLGTCGTRGVVREAGRTGSSHASWDMAMDRAR